MPSFGLKSVFSKLFSSVMLTLVLFATCMVILMNMVHNNSVDARWEVLAKQIITQVDPFVDELDNATTMNELLQARFMLAVIKKSFDIFDESLQAKMGLYDRQGHLLIQTDDSDLPKELPADPSLMTRILPAFFSSDTLHVTAMSDRGYTILYEPRNPPKRSELWAVLNWFTGTVVLVGLMSLVLWQIARSMTWRINQMSKQMEQLGEGDFSVRVPAEGNDEIASLARGFNQAAQKIEQLINANNLLLAHASHELRTPITRIRLQVEMMDMLTNELSEKTKAQFNKRAQAVNRDLTGLNDLVESILLVSRLDAGHAAQANERLDFYDLVSQECQHYPEATLYGDPLVIEGQPKLLIHLVRNLLNNALIHGEPPIEVQVYSVVQQKDALQPPKQLTDKIAAHKAELKAESDAEALRLNADLSESEDDLAQNEAGTGNDTEQTDLKEANGSISANNTEHSEGDNLSASAVESSETQANSKKNASKKAKNNSTKSNETGFARRLRRVKAEPVEVPKYAVLAVIDQGKGIPLDKREEIFSPFVRLQQKKKGSGLGLSLVSQIVEAHNGRIRTDTYQGHTRFIVLLPVDDTVEVERPNFS